MTYRQTIRLIYSEIKRSMLIKFYSFFPMLFLTILSFSEFLFKNQELDNPSMYDHLAYFFRGLPSFQYVDSRSIFTIPHSLILFVFYILFNTLSYINKESKSSNFNIIIRYTKKEYWMISQLITSYYLVFLQVYLFYIVTFLLNRFVSQSSVIHTGYLNDKIFDFSLSNHFASDFKLYLYLVIPLLLYFICVVGICLNFVIGFNLTMVTILLLLISSVYFKTKFLIGNLLMIYRTNWLNQGGIPVFICSLYYLLITVPIILFLVLGSKKWELFS